MERRGFLKALLGAPLALPIIKKALAEPEPKLPEFLAFAADPPKGVNTCCTEMPYSMDDFAYFDEFGYYGPNTHEALLDFDRRHNRHRISVFSTPPRATHWRIGC